ncbi:MAG: carboxypeptidase-like regulatory domain-containing protein, partial [Vicinamibacterales bacterium]
MMSWLRARTWLALALVLVGLAAPAAAQQTESRIVGRIVDQSDAALPGVTITVTSKSTGAMRNVVTEGDGSFVVTNLAPGAYSVTADLEGFQQAIRDVVLGVGQVENATIMMRVGGVAETVSVSAVAPVLDVNSAKIGVNVSPEEVENLPVNGRNFANLMTLATGATSDGNGGWSSVRFNGKSNQQNYLNYDGV